MPENASHKDNGRKHFTNRPEDTPIFWPIFQGEGHSEYGKQGHENKYENIRDNTESNVSDGCGGHCISGRNALDCPPVRTVQVRHLHPAS